MTTSKFDKFLDKITEPHARDKDAVTSGHAVYACSREAGRQTARWVLGQAKAKSRVADFGSLGEKVCVVSLKDLEIICGAKLDD